MDSGKLNMRLAVAVPVGSMIMSLRDRAMRWTASFQERVLVDWRI